MKTIPNGQFSTMPYETINDGLGRPPSIESYQSLHGITHYDFRIFQNKDGYGIKARPYANWKERLEWDMKQNGY
jgi:hypothetical protein